MVLVLTKMHKKYCNKYLKYIATKTDGTASSVYCSAVLHFFYSCTTRRYIEDIYVTNYNFSSTVSCVSKRLLISIILVHLVSTFVVMINIFDVISVTERVIFGCLHLKHIEILNRVIFDKYRNIT